MATGRETALGYQNMTRKKVLRQENELEQEFLTKGVVMKRETKIGDSSGGYQSQPTNNGVFMQYLYWTPQPRTRREQKGRKKELVSKRTLLQEIK